MATLTVYRGARAGTAISTTSASAGGDEFANTRRELLYVRNNSGSPITLTFATPGAPWGMELNDVTATVAAGAFVVCGPFHQQSFNNASGRVAVAYSSATNVSVAAIGK